MQAYFTLGRTGLRVSRFALGTMTFGTDWGWGADQAAARAIFDAYADAGGNLFDTADLYVGGTSETWLGEFIAARKLRDRAVIVTKASFNGDPGNPNGGGNGRKHLARAIEGSLKRLATDHIDLFILHAWDRLTPAEEVMRTLDDLVRASKILHVGLSNVPALYTARAQTLAEWRGWEPVSALQLGYSLIERNIEHEYIALATQHGMGVLAWKSARLRPAQRQIPHGHRRGPPQSTGELRQPRLRQAARPAQRRNRRGTGKGRRRRRPFDGASGAELGCQPPRRRLGADRRDEAGTAPR